MLNFVAIILALFLFNSEELFISIPFALIYAGFCTFRYKKSLIRFKKISIWIQFIVITMAAAFFLNGLAGSGRFSAEGLIIGLKMILRAIVIIMGFAAISIELRNPLIRAVLYNKGFANLYQSLGMAFSALPGIISDLPDSKNIFRKNHFSSIFTRSELLLDQFEKEQGSRSKVFIITGEIHGGKTTFAKQVITGLKEKKYNVGGFLAPAFFENDVQNGYDLWDIRSGDHLDLCRLNPHKGWVPFGRYNFNPQGFSTGKELLDNSKHHEVQVFFIDEIGPLEMKNEGWAKAVTRLCRQSMIPQVWIVRRSLLSSVSRHWNVADIEVYDIATDSTESMIRSLEAFIGNGQKDRQNAS